MNNLEKAKAEILGKWWKQFIYDDKFGERDETIPEFDLKKFENNTLMEELNWFSAWDILDVFDLALAKGRELITEKEVQKALSYKLGKRRHHLCRRCPLDYTRTKSNDDNIKQQRLKFADELEELKSSLQKELTRISSQCCVNQKDAIEQRAKFEQIHVEICHLDEIKRKVQALKSESEK